MIFCWVIGALLFIVGVLVREVPSLYVYAWAFGRSPEDTGFGLIMAGAFVALVVPLMFVDPWRWVR